MDKITLTFIALWQIFTCSRIALKDRWLFCLLYPFQLAVVILSPKNLKGVSFLNGSPFYFLGKHYNLLLTHIHCHLNHYLPLYTDAKTVVDVGASFGTFPLVVNYFEPSAKIYSIEMVEESFKVLQKNCRHLKNTYLFNYAIGKTNSQVNYSFDPDFPEGGNLGLVKYSRVGTARQITLDDFMAKQNIKAISLLKIDAEGHELPILQSASTALSISKCVLVENQL